MENGITDLYQLPNITEYEDVHLLTLWENCVSLEEQLEAVKDRMSDYDRQLLECYINMRNDLEQETVKAAIRWGKQHCL